MSSYLDTLEIGATIEMLGPMGVVGYPAPKTITHGAKVVQVNAAHLVLIAGGTGIAPMLQLIRAVFERREDTTTKITLVYASRALEYVIALDQLEPMANMFPSRMKIHHVLSQASPGDSKELGAFTIGRLTQDLLATLLPAAAPDMAVFHCGPPDFDEAVGKALLELQFTPAQIHLF
jgi:cytochrome-b5 reductase